jgi:membrane protein involved in colicin uptake
MPAEKLNTGDNVMATKRAAGARKAAAEPTPATATEELGGDDICDYCHVRMTVVRQMVLNDKKHEVRACTANPNHVKTVPIE